MTASAVIAIVGLAVSLVVAVVGGLLGLLIRSNEKRLADLERDHERSTIRHEETTARLHQAELEIAKLQGLHKLEGAVERIDKTLSQLLQEVATMRGQLRPWSTSKPSGNYSIPTPSMPPKR